MQESPVNVEEETNDSVRDKLSGIIAFLQMNANKIKSIDEILHKLVSLHPLLLFEFCYVTKIYIIIIVLI